MQKIECYNSTKVNASYIPFIPLHQQQPSRHRELNDALEYSLRMTEQSRESESSSEMRGQVIFNVKQTCVPYLLGLVHLVEDHHRLLPAVHGPLFLQFRKVQWYVDKSGNQASSLVLVMHAWSSRPKRQESGTA